MIHISFTDQWQTLLDENGKPLIGRVKFFNADSTQYKSIYYDMHGETQGENPQYTLQDGRLEHQVFLGAGVYTCRVEKFLGTDVSSMRDHANDDTYWQNYKSFNVYGGAEEVEGVGDIASGFCDTIAALRLVDPSEHGIVSVVGYYSKDDGIEPRTYVWVEGNSDAEDYGSTIVSSVSDYTSAGRWKLCETPVLCATTFGVFPNRSSTIQASDLSDKATALATFSKSSVICNSVLFNAGHYYFSAGTRLQFNKLVTTSGTPNKSIKFDMDGVQNLEEGETLVGSVEIGFVGGFETKQSAILFDNDDYITIYFGSGAIKSSWISGNISKHINYSSTFKNITCYITNSESKYFCNEGNSFVGWNFIGDNAGSSFSIPQDVVFRNCRFSSKCFYYVDDTALFDQCSDVYQYSITISALPSRMIWNDDGSSRGTGTIFHFSTLTLNQTFTGSIDNSCIKVLGGINIISSSNAATLKYFCKDYVLNGNIDFLNESTLFASQYRYFTQCVNTSIAKEKKINLENGSYTYNINTTDVSNPRTFVFENGAITLTKTGSGNVKDIVNLDNIVALFDNSISNIKVVAKDSVISGINNTIIDFESYGSTITADSGKSVIIKEGKFSDTILNGNVRLLPNSSNVVAQEFYGCKFDKPITIYSSDNTVTACCVKIVGCTFIIDNSGTKTNAIVPFEQTGGSWANDEINSFVIENNVCLIDAYILPTKRYNAIIDDYTGTARTTPTNDGSVYSNGTEYKTKGLYGVSNTDLNNMDFFKNRFLHFGDINILINAFTANMVGLMTYPIIDIEGQIHILTTSFSVEKV